MSKEKVTVDVRGSVCPIPVIETKRAMEAHPHTVIETIVDNGISRDNVIKFGESRECKISVESMNGVYTITLTPRAESATDTLFVGGAAMLANMVADTPITPSPMAIGNKVLVLTKPWFGAPDEELGKTLLQTFLFCLTESKAAPKKIYCLNGGVTLVTSQSPVLEQLTMLAEQGVAIYACGICLDAYGLKKDVQVGEITNMYAIAEDMVMEDVIVI